MLCKTLQIHASTSDELARIVSSLNKEKGFVVIHGVNAVSNFLQTIFLCRELEDGSSKGPFSTVASLAQYKCLADTMVAALVVVKWEEVLPRDAPEALPKAE